MESSIRTKIAIIAGILLIAFVASLVTLPLIDSANTLQNAPKVNIKKIEQSEKKMLDLIAHEKAELEAKIGGKLNIP